MTLFMIFPVPISHAKVQHHEAARVGGHRGPLLPLRYLSKRPAGAMGIIPWKWKPEWGLAKPGLYQGYSLHFTTDWFTTDWMGWYSSEFFFMWLLDATGLGIHPAPEVWKPKGSTCSRTVVWWQLAGSSVPGCSWFLRPWPWCILRGLKRGTSCMAPTPVLALFSSLRLPPGMERKVAAWRAWTHWTKFGWHNPGRLQLDACGEHVARDPAIGGWAALVFESFWISLNHLEELNAMDILYIYMRVCVKIFICIYTHFFLFA